jgi:hypothetical protein
MNEVGHAYYHGQLYRYTLDVYTWPFQFQNKSVPRKQTMNYRKVATSVGSFHNNFFNFEIVKLNVTNVRFWKYFLTFLCSLSIITFIVKLMIVVFSFVVFILIY